MRAERDRFVALAFCWADVLLEMDSETQVMFAAGPAATLIGRPAESLVGQSLYDLVTEKDRPLLDGLLGIARSKGRIENATVRFRRPNGSDTTVSLYGHYLEDLGGHYFLALRKGPPQDRKGTTKVLSRDAKSGLYDADAFTNVVKQNLKGPGGGEDFNQMTLIELGEFDALRERLGAEGEQDLLNTLGAFLRASSVNGDTAARITDDRYGIVHSASMDIAALEERIAEVARQMDPEGKGVSVDSATVEADPEETSAEDLANGLVYAINRFRSTKGQEFNIKELSSQMSSLVTEAAESVKSFNQIISTADFDPVFQPIIDVKTGKIHHYEALVRFRGERGKTSPFETITFAEETGLIVDFDLAMLAKVVEWLSRTPRNSSTSIAANLSGHSVGSQKYIQGLRSLMSENLWARGRLLFEITESARMDDLDLASEFIQSLRKDGYEVCLDDFGAGAANFEYLSTLEVDVVKLDGPVLRNAQKAPKGRAFLRALVALCRDLGVETIGEQIDDVEGLKFIRECGVQYVQGYLFGKPSANLKDFANTQSMSVFQRRGAR